MEGVPVAYEPPGSPGAFAQGIADIKRRNNDQFKKINTLLNICDSYKDAGTGASKNALFKGAVEELFGRINIRAIPGVTLTGTEASEVIINRIKEYVLNNIEYGAIPPQKICWLQEPKSAKVKKHLKQRLQLYKNVPKKERGDWNPDSESAKLPDTVKYAFHESGYNPMEVHPNMKIILTPGSYIDPGSRTKVGDITDGSPPAEVWSHYSKIRSDTFHALGFPYTKISEFQGVHSTGIMTIDLTMINHKELIKIRDDYSVNQGSADYFIGNQRKNEWLRDNQFKTDSVTKELAQKYILAKELGDTMQVIDAKLYMGLPSGQVCVFTGDRVVTIRCHELGVPVCLKDTSERQFADLGRCYYYRPSLNPAKEFENRVSSEIESAIKNNQNVVAQLEGILVEGGFRLGDNIIAIRAELKSFFEEVIAGIKYIETNMLKNAAFVSIIKSKGIDEIKLICSELTALQIAKPGIITLGSTNCLFKFWGSSDKYNDEPRSYYESHYKPNQTCDHISYLTSDKGPKETRNLSEILIYYNNIDNPVERIELAVSRAGRPSMPSAKMQHLIANRKGLAGPVAQSGGYTIDELEAAIKRHNMEYYAQEIPTKSPTDHFYEIVYEIVKHIFNSNPALYKDIHYYSDDENCITGISYSFLCLMKLFFDYIGETPTAFEVLMPCVSDFMDTYIMNTSLQDFKNFYELIPYVKNANKYLEIMKHINSGPIDDIDDIEGSIKKLREQLISLSPSTQERFAKLLQENDPVYDDLLVRYQTSLITETKGENKSFQTPIHGHKRVRYNRNSSIRRLRYRGGIGGTRKRTTRKTRKNG
jgi:hypothetical protein